LGATKATSYVLQIPDSDDNDYTYQSSDAEADLHNDLSESDSQHDRASTAAGVNEETTDMADGEFTDMTDGRRAPQREQG
jgi:hypothetical protein